MSAAILNYTEDGGPSFQTQIVIKDWFPSVPNGLVKKKRLHLTYICTIRVRTLEQEERA